MAQSNVKLVREPIKVIIYLKYFRIKGTIYLSIGERLTDFINNENLRFIPVTDATIESLNPLIKFSQTMEFISINTSHILFINPVEKRTQVEQKSII